MQGEEDEEEEEERVEWEGTAWVCDCDGRGLAPGPTNTGHLSYPDITTGTHPPTVLSPAPRPPDSSAQALLRPSSASGQTSTADTNTTSSSAYHTPLPTLGPPRARLRSGLPLGYIVFTFMISMMLGPGSCAYTILAALLTRSSASQANEAQELLQVTSLLPVLQRPLNIFIVAALVTGFFSTRYAVLTASALVLTFSSLMTGLVVVSGTESHAGYPQRALNDGESVVEQWIGGWMQRVEMEAYCSAGTKIRRR
ncbi:hypothetical protein DFP72DRAFT_1059393 [Ephemerocybe angulata]|uniref:Uncharacterized protein n=1 Tax=Ephemerocybe angulata TaxID=980116 RepID=A0A8H6IHS5_9AGAR|nr:hypothetical protein DFP72DRAFT_1059393 [Tulosesus angulatus]